VGHGSPFGVESLLGQLPLHRIRQGMMPPLIKSGTGGFTRLSWVILPKNLDSSMLAHKKACEGNLPVGTQIRSLRMLDSLDGALGAPTNGHPLCRFVPCSGCSRWLRPDLAGFAFEP
jgi:hypothetical protein